MGSNLKSLSQLTEEFAVHNKITNQKFTDYLASQKQLDLVHLKMIYTEALEQNETLEWARGKASAYLCYLDEQERGDSEITELTNLLRELTERKQQVRLECSQSNVQNVT
jgi:hypothetical protein